MEKMREKKKWNSQNQNERRNFSIFLVLNLILKIHEDWLQLGSFIRPPLSRTKQSWKWDFNAFRNNSPPRKSLIEIQFNDSSVRGADKYWNNLNDNGLSHRKWQIAWYSRIVNAFSVPNFLSTFFPATNSKFPGIR